MKKTLIITFSFVILVGLTAAMTDVPETITLDGGKKGAVAFPHKAHIDAGATCKSCHHNVAGDMDAPEKKCSDCHTKDSKVKAMKAFHKNCIDCHKTVNKEKGLETPVKCNDCHKK